MFDPTIFDNLKVVLEGAIYDLDLSGFIHITNRDDSVNLAKMNRTFAAEFQRVAGMNQAEIRLTANLKDLSAELLEVQGEKPGCELIIKFQTKVSDVQRQCPNIEIILKDVWGSRPSISQTISYEYGNEDKGFSNQITLSFGRKLDEEQIEDLPALVQYTLHSLEKLDELR